MGEITFSNETVQIMNLTGKQTGAQIRDCIVEDDRIVFVVEKGHLGAAIGSKAKNLEKLRNLFKKNVKFVEYDADVFMGGVFLTGGVFFLGFLIGVVFVLTGFFGFSCFLIGFFIGFFVGLGFVGVFGFSGFFMGCFTDFFTGFLPLGFCCMFSCPP